MDWSILEDWPSWPFDAYYPYCDEKNVQPVLAQNVPTQAQPYPADQAFTLMLSPPNPVQPPQPSAETGKGENPREIRNKAEKQRRDKMNRSIAQLAAIVPPVVASGRKVDKTSVLKLTAHYLRAHQYVFGDTINSEPQFKANSARALLGLLKGFILTTTYKGLVVVVSQNVQQYLGYSELDLIGQSIFNFTHEEDHQMLREQLMPKSYLLGPNGELLISGSPDAKQKVADTLAKEKRTFIIRFIKLGQRTEPRQYVTCHVEGTMRKSDKACHNRCCQMVRRVRARSDNPCSSGNDVVFVGLVRPTSETFISENTLESFRMEYRTRHTIDGKIINCDSRISLVTGYMTHEVNGVNAMNFMHRDDVRWVIIALREMYDQHRLAGESCYRLMTKSGKFIYMQTKGFLDVDQHSRAVTSFVCTNTVVDEQIGKRLINLMKKKFMLMVNNNENPIADDDNDAREVNDNALPVEDPRQLEKVILHLVTNLPSPKPKSPQTAFPDHEDRSPFHLSIIPPQKERIVNAIEKIYSVIKLFDKEPISKMQHYKAIKENEQSNDEDIRIISNETVPTASTTSLTSVSVTDLVGSHSVSRLISSDNTLLQRPNRYVPNRIFGSNTLTPSMDIDPVLSTSFSQSCSTFIPRPSGCYSSVDPILLECLYSTQIDHDPNRYGSDLYAFDHYGGARSTTPFTTSVIPEQIYTTSVSTSSSVITSDFPIIHSTMYSNALRLSSFSDRHRIIRPSPDSTRLLEISQQNHHLMSLNNDSCTGETCFLNYESPLVNYFSPITCPSTSHPSAITDPSSTFVAEIINPNYEMIIPTDTSTLIDRRYQDAHSLYDTVVHSNSHLMESYRTDEQNDYNNQALFENVTSNQIDYLEENPMIVAPTNTSCRNESVPLEAKQLNHEIVGYTKSNMEPSNSSVPISSDVSEPKTSSCGTKRPNDCENIDEIPKKKIALDVTVDATDSFVEKSILYTKYLNNDELTDSTYNDELTDSTDNDELTDSSLEQELNSDFQN